MVLRLWAAAVVAVLGIGLGPSLHGSLASSSGWTLVFSDDFTRETPGDPPSQWDVEHAEYMAFGVVHAEDLPSGRALRAVRGSESPDDGMLVGITSPPLPVADSDTILAVDYKVKVIRGSHFGYIVGGNIYVNWRVDPDKNFIAAGQTIGQLHDGWNRIRVIADRERNEMYVYLNAMDENARNGPFPLRSRPSTWKGQNLRLAHVVNQTSSPEALVAEVKVASTSDADAAFDEHAPWPPVQEPALRPVRGERVPRMLSPNLLVNGDFDFGLWGWTLVKEPGAAGEMRVVSTEHGPALQIEKRSDGVVRLVSDRIAVQPGARYQITGLYHTHNAAFGNWAEFTLIQISDPSQPESSDVPAWSPSMSTTAGNRTLFNSPEGDWRRKTRQFTTSANTRFVRLVLTLEGPPVTVLLDNLYFSLPNEAPRFTPQLEREFPSSILQARRMMTEGRQKLEARPDSVAKVEVDGGIPRLFIDGKPRVPHIHFGDVSNPARAYFRQFGEHDVKLHVVALRNITRHLWTGYKEYHLDRVDDILWDAVVRDPEGYFIVNIDVTPYPSWHEDFPEDAAQDADGVYAVSRHDRVAPPDYWSEEYREQVYDLIRTFVEHIHKQPYGKAVVGYFISGGEDGQFYWQVGRQTIQDGNAPGSLPLFRRWIRERYPDLDELRSTWGDPKITYETIRPGIQNAKYPGAFMDPQQHRSAVDTLTYLNEELARFLLEAARIVKETAGKDVIVGAYYGRGASASVYPMFAQTKVMLKSDLIDFMVAQPGYAGWRDAGSEGLVNWVFDSVRRAGKIMVTELDYRTWVGGLTSLEHDFGVARFWNLEELEGAAARDFGKLFSFMGGAWWYEMTGGWYHDDSIMAMIGRLQDAAQKLYEKEPVLSPADIVFVADEDSYYWTTEQYNIAQARHTHSLAIQQRAINRAGFKYDFYYMDDLLAHDMTDYKVYVFLNVYYVDDAKRAFIEKLKRDGRILVWQYAPGYVTPQELSLASTEELVGMKLGTDEGPVFGHFAGADQLPAQSSARMLLSGVEGKPLGLGLRAATTRFYVDDPRVQPLAYYQDGRVAAALIQHDSHTSIYVGHPSGFTPEFLANLAEMAGVHTYLQPAGDLFMHNRDDFIVLHGVEGGERVLSLPYDARVVELLTGRVLAESRSKIRLHIRPNETLWLHVEPVEDHVRPGCLCRPEHEP